MFYVYKWFDKNTKEIFYIGKGCNNRYKSTNKRNKLFIDYYNTHECDVEIIEYFQNEFDAFQKEFELIQEYKQKGQCKCNVDRGGKGGLEFVWTSEMRNYYSKYNGMKSEKQRQRMSEYNPMKNPDIVRKVALKRSKPIIIGNKLYENVGKASKELNVYENTIKYWLSRGYSNDFKICYYQGQSNINIQIKSHSCNCKAILIDNEKFKTVKLAAEYLGTTSSKRIRYLKLDKPYKGHICKYDNQ